MFHFLSYRHRDEATGNMKLSTLIWLAGFRSMSKWGTARMQAATASKWKLNCAAAMAIRSNVTAAGQERGKARRRFYCDGEIKIKYETCSHCKDNIAHICPMINYAYSRIFHNFLYFIYVNVNMMISQCAWRSPYGDFPFGNFLPSPK